MIKRAFAPDELRSLVEAILSSTDEDELVRSLRGDDAQAFIDVMDEVRSSLAHHREADQPKIRPIDQALESLNLLTQIRKKGLKVVYRMCGRNRLLPRSLQVPLCYDRQGFPLYAGGFADVWKGEHLGQDVAVKVIRTPSSVDLQSSRKIISVGCAILLRIHSLTESHIEVLQGGCNMEIASTSKCAPADRSDDDWNPFRDGIRVDGGRKPQCFHEGTPGRRQTGTCGFFI